MTVSLQPTTIPKVSGVSFKTTIAVDVTAVAYTVGDSIGTGGKALGINRAVKLVSASISLKDSVATKPAFTILFFNTAPAGTYTENGAMSVTDADTVALCGAVEIAAGDFKQLYTSGPMLAVWAGSPQNMRPADGSDLYIAILADNVWTPASTSDLQITLEFEPV